MRKVRMMMIPSVGYFTVVSKQDQSYLDFLNLGLATSKIDIKCKDEDVILESLLGPIISEYGWKICFLSEADIFF
jgi:hypothetical protein